ncbi:hypothetical protein H0E87_022335 [Populus deltoides]|uniref:Uncharacterized protein n=1 Tax=Populus deltoides TaxID=3696 RepID=A0A8T2XJR9_POPDE|nr:hypothetical protein H0E87_022335 [Populus deltoides]
MTADTTLSSYWLNWRFFLCATWVLILMITASLLIWKNERRCKVEHDSGENKQEAEASLYDDETWRPCLKGIHPAWLLVFRLFAFIVLSVLLAIAVLMDGGSIFYYYTQWTFTSVTIYFGLGSLLSMRGCYQYHKRVGGDRVDNVEADAEQGCCVTSALGKGSNTSMAMESSNSHEILDVRQPAGKWAFIFQIIFQMNAGAVMLTDSVFWFVLVPFLASKDYHLNALIISMHSLNAIFLLGDTALNCLVSFLGSFHKSFSSFFNEMITNLNLLSLSEVSFVSDRVFLHLDNSICPIPVDCPCHFQTLVAISIP